MGSLLLLVLLSADHPVITLAEYDAIQREVVPRNEAALAKAEAEFRAREGLIELTEELSFWLERPDEALSTPHDGCPTSEAQVTLPGRGSAKINEVCLFFDWQIDELPVTTPDGANRKLVRYRQELTYARDADGNLVGYQAQREEISSRVFQIDEPCLNECGMRITLGPSKEPAEVRWAAPIRILGFTYAYEFIGGMCRSE